LSTGDLTAPSGEDGGHTHESACLNCSAALSGPYCQQCGQHAHVHRTLGAFFHDLLHGAFHFEGRIWRTLPMLTFRPGKLTREYIDGRRASYISPIALFLFAAFLLYASTHLLGHETETHQAGTIEAAIGDEQASLAKWQDKLAKAGTAADRKVAQAQVDRAQTSLEALTKLRDSGVTTAELGKGPGASSDIAWLDAALKKFRANPELALYKLQMSAYKYSWLLIPISAPFLWLLFPFNRRFHIYDHTVFVTYSLAFMTLFGVVLTVGDTVGVPLLAVAAVVVPPLHMYRQLKGSYGLTRGAALWRTVILLGFSFTALLLFVLVLLSGLG